MQEAQQALQEKTKESGVFAYSKIKNQKMKKKALTVEFLQNLAFFAKIRHFCILKLEKKQNGFIYLHYF